MIHDVLIVGAGLSGLKAAGDLCKAGRSVLLLDKGRGVGGRAATRRWDGVPMDHGAQFFTARSPEFKAQVEAWMRTDVCFEWTRAFHQWDQEHGLRAPDPADAKHPRYACHAGMSALGKDLAAKLPPEAVCLETCVTRLTCVDGDRWETVTESAMSGPPPAGRSLILALPTPQALELLQNSGLLDGLDPDGRAKLAAVQYAPTLAVMLRGPAARPEWQGIQLRDETVIWISDDTGKRVDGGETTAAHGKNSRVFALHGAVDFSRRWQDLDLDAAAEKMVARAGEIAGAWITQLPERQVHRWRYANVPKGVPDIGALCAKAGAGRKLPVYFCGDAFLGAKIEGAYCSGLEAAKSILAAPSV